MKASKFLITGLVAVALFIALPLSLYAAPAENYPMAVTQPDGATVNLFAGGDEFFNYLHDAKGYLVKMDTGNGWFVYIALDSDGKIAYTDNIAADGGRFYKKGGAPGEAKPVDENIGITIHDLDFNVNSDLIYMPKAPEPPPETKKEQPPATAMTEYIEPPGGVVPLTGTVNNVVMMICFSDEDRTILNSDRQLIEGIYNTGIPGRGSMRDYIHEISGGVFQTETIFVGMDNGTALMYRDAHPRSYYQPKSVLNPDGYADNDERWARERVLLRNAVASINGSNLLNGIDLDANGDGFVDSIVFVILGESVGWGNLLWPHCSALWSEEVFLNGIRVMNYNLILMGWFHDECVAVAVHEYLHTLGFPDLYRYESDGTPVGWWDIMASHTANPQYPNSWSRIKYGGWGNGIEMITGNNRYTLYPLGNDGGVNAYGIPIPGYDDEFILLEYRNGVYNGSHYEKFYSRLKWEYDESAGFGWHSAADAGLVISRVFKNSRGNAPYVAGVNTAPDEVYVFRPGDESKNSGTGDIRIASLIWEMARTSFGEEDRRIDEGDIIYLYDGSNTGFVIYNVSQGFKTISFDVQVWPVTDRDKPVVRYMPGPDGDVSAILYEHTFPSGGSVQAGFDIHFTASPSSGYKVDKWTVDGTTVQNGGNQYTYIVPATVNFGDIILVRVSFKPNDVSSPAPSLAPAFAPAQAEKAFQINEAGKIKDLFKPR